MGFTPEHLDLALPALDFTPPAIDLDTLPLFDVEPLTLAKETET